MVLGACPVMTVTVEEVGMEATTDILVVVVVVIIVGTVEDMAEVGVMVVMVVVCLGPPGG